MALPAFSIQDLELSFLADGPSPARHLVLQNFSAAIPEGSSVVVIGPSGQGKTTLLKALAGLVLPAKGDVQLFGKNLYQASSSEKKQLMLNLGMVFQKNALFDSLTCSENIAFPLREVTALSEDQIQQRSQQFLEAVGLAHAKTLFPDEISGGMQKRLGIARVLAVHPKVIFYDDPTAGLDPITSRKIIDLIQHFHQTTRSTIISVTNDMNRAVQLLADPNDQLWYVDRQKVINGGNLQRLRTNADPQILAFMRGQQQSAPTQEVSP